MTAINYEMAVSPLFEEKLQPGSHKMHLYLLENSRRIGNEILFFLLLFSFYFSPSS